MINIHNGDAMLVTARREGLAGEQMAFREALVSGPVRPGEDWLSMRAHFLSSTFGEELLRTSHSLFEQEQALVGAAAHDEIVLWFEHDLFCLINFLYLLTRFRDRNVSLVWSSDPLALREPADLAHLFQSRTPATAALFDLAARAWAAYTSPDPRTLNEALDFDDAGLPFLRDGLRLHASRFPSVRNGLGSVENRLLTLIAGGAAEFSILFAKFDERPPRFGFGDSHLLQILRSMAARPVPLIGAAEASEAPPRAVFTITEAGQRVLQGAGGEIAPSPPDTWLGGAHLTEENGWRWDEDRGRIVGNPPAGS